MPLQRRFATLMLALAFALPVNAYAAVRTPARGDSGVTYRLSLPNGSRAIVYADGLAKIYTPSKDRRLDGGAFHVRRISMGPSIGGVAGGGLPDEATLAATLAHDLPAHPYAPGWVVAVYAPSVGVPQDVVSVDKATVLAMRDATAQRRRRAAPAYTNDAKINDVLAGLVVDRSERLYRAFSRSALAAASEASGSSGGRTLHFADAVRLHVVGASVPQAVRALARLRGVEYVSPDWIVDAMHVNAVKLDNAEKASALRRADDLRSATTMQAQLRLSAASMPKNYASASSLQSMLNAPSDDAMAAYDEIERHFHQLPGQGEIVTNVSIGDVDDASAASNPSDPCNGYVTSEGPTTEMVGGQRYLNLPSMPLIPTYVANADGTLSGSDEVCGADPFLSEVDLDFSMMSPLPHDLQRSGETGSGVTDLLGIAPGAQYRLVVPADSTATISDIQTALLAAALQNPHPNVITASLGFGYDSYGFPSRFLEDDPLTRAIVAAIVKQYHIVVCIAANDGTRTTTKTAIGPSGGSTPTEALAPGGTPTTLDDVAFSTVPSLDFGTGSIDAGGTTLDDIFANPPQFAANGFVQAQHAYAETRWTGSTTFSSGYGSRVDLSAPGDNVIAFQHHAGGADDAVDVVIQGGTSASSPEIAAAAAVVLQVARLTGRPIQSPTALRALLERTGSAVPAVPQADRRLNVGPQVDVRRAVEALLTEAHASDKPSVARVAIEQRRNDFNADGTFVTDTDPSNIDLAGSQNALLGDALDERAWITIAPDWEYVPSSAKYSLTIAGTRKVLATTPWARLQPEAILQAAGFTLASRSNRSVKLTYAALAGGRSVSSTFSLTFGPAPATTDQVLAPLVPAVVRGATIPVTYDLRHAGHVTNPVLTISEPGRVDPWTGLYYHATYTQALRALVGTVDIPVSALHGGGVYGIGISRYFAPGLTGYDGDYAFTRVVPQPSDARPHAPLLSADGTTFGHSLEIPYGGKFEVSYDVTKVPGANGAELEIAAPGPNFYTYNTFDNPNGSERDDDGVDGRSVYYVRLPGTSGRVDLDGAKANLRSTMYHDVRVIPMKSGTAAGEASDASTIEMDGIAAADGGSVQSGGFGVNAHGSDGFLTSLQESASGVPMGSLEIFDQGTDSVTQTIGSESDGGYATIPLPGSNASSGMYGNDVGLVGSFDTATLAFTYNLLNPVASGAIGSTWSPPPPWVGFLTLYLWSAAENQDNDTAAFLGQDPTAPAHDTWRVFTSQILQNISSSLYDVTGPLQGYATPDFDNLAEDTATNMAYGVGRDASSDCMTPTIVTVNLSSGAVGSFAGTGFDGHLSVDSTTHKAVMLPGFCHGGGFTIFDLTSQTGIEVFPPSDPGSYEYVGYVAVDPIHHLFLLVGWRDDSELNNTSYSVYIYDETGKLRKTLTGFNPGNFYALRSEMLQLNPQTRTGYMISWDGGIAPFKY